MKELNERDFIEQMLKGSNQSLPEAAYEPLAALIEHAVSANGATARVYRAAFALFLQYLEAQRSGALPPALKAAWCPFAEVTKESRRTVWIFRPPAAVLRWVDKADFEGFMSWRATEGDSTSTIKTRVAGVKSLFRAGYGAGIIDVQQIMQLGVRIYQLRLEPFLTSSETEPAGRWLTAAEVRLLRGVVQTQTKRGKRDLALLDCMLYLGLRSEELRSLTWSDFEISGNWWVTVKHDQPWKRRRLKVHPILRLSLITWFSAVDFWQEPADTPLFVSIQKGGTLGRRAITAEAMKQILNHYEELAGLALATGTECLTPTILRRTCGRHAFANGASLKQVQELLGHSSLDLTASFIGAFDQDQKSAADYIRYDR